MAETPKPEAPDEYPLGYFDEEGDFPHSWCEDTDRHKDAHRFCSDHQAMWCRLCDRHGCPQCVDDPHCPECHVGLNSEEHDWDCSYAGEDDDDD